MSTSNPSPSSTTNENIIFKYNQYATSFSDKLLKFYKDEEFFDLVLVVGKDSVKIQAHKLVLSAWSEYFLQLFRNRNTLLKGKEIKIQEIEAYPLKLIINYMYSGSIELKLEEIESLLRCAVILKIQSLVDGCYDFLEKNFNTTDCWYWLDLAKELSLTGLQEKSLNFIYINFKEVTKRTQFMLLSEIELKDLLFNKNPHDDLEEQVFLSLVAWTEYDKANREPLLFELLSLVRYQFLTPKFIIKNRISVGKTAEHRELIYRWLQYHLEPESRSLEEKNFNLNPKQSKNIDKMRIVHINNQLEVEMQSYNRTTKTWFFDKRTDALGTYRNAESMIVFDEKLFIIGAVNRSSKFAENTALFIDLKASKRIIMPQMMAERCRSQLANIRGHLFVFGGFEDEECEMFVESAEFFNFSTRKWTYLEPLRAINEKQKIAAHKGILYIFDFYYGCLQCFDVAANQWTSKQLPIDDVKGDFRVAGVDNNLYCVIGGEFKKELEWTTITNLIIKRFDLSNDTWCDVDVLEMTGYMGKTATIIGNSIFFCTDNYEISEYNLETKKLTKITVSTFLPPCTCIFPVH